MYAVKIVLPKGEEHDDLSAAEAETPACGGRRVRRYCVQDLVCSSVWTIDSGHHVFRQ